jgi:glycosyltransferase involved in cell wall biosynthesis
VIKNVSPALVQTWLPQMDIMGGIAALEAGIPWIVTERTAGIFYADIPLVARLRLFLGRFSASVVANSEIGEQYWRENGAPNIKLSTIRNALDFEGIQRAAARRSEPSSKPLFMVVGRLHRDKAVEIIVRAITKLPDPNMIEVWIMGEGAERTRIEHEIESSLLHENVKLLPYQPDWWRWLAAASGLISMSRYEGNPNAVLEAMAGLCPVILSDIPGHREIADISSALFVPVDDVTSLSSAIVNLLDNRDVTRRRAVCASECVATMTTTAMADAYQTLYQNVLSRSA